MCTTGKTEGIPVLEEGSEKHNCMQKVDQKERLSI